MEASNWVGVKRFLGAYGDGDADVCVAELEAAGIPAQRIPPSALGARAGGGIVVSVLVPPEFARAAMALLAEDVWVEVACFTGVEAEEQASALMTALRAAVIAFIRFPYEPETDPLRSDKVRVLVPREDLAEGNAIAKRVR